MIVFLEETAPTNAELLAVKINQRRVTGTEHEYSFSKAKVQHNGVWSPFCARFCACPEISSESNSVQTPQKSF